MVWLVGLPALLSCRCGRWLCGQRYNIGDVMRQKTKGKSKTVAKSVPKPKPSRPVVLAPVRPTPEERKRFEDGLRKARIKAHEEKPTAKIEEKPKPKAPAPKPIETAPKPETKEKAVEPIVMKHEQIKLTKPKPKTALVLEKPTHIEPTTPVVVHEVASVEPWRCVWCGKVNTVNAHACDQCGQMR
jgi:hypothetical protein